MEVLTIVSALALVGVVLALWCFADRAHHLPAIATLVFGTSGAVLTATIHFVQLTAVRQLWRAGHLTDYRLVWPSSLFAAEYFVWDVLVGLTMTCASFVLAGARSAEHARGALLLSGVLCLVGVVGPFSGQIVLQNSAVLGYAVGLPLAAALTARVFRSVPPSSAAA